jgi:hypothetical protein
MNAASDGKRLGVTGSRRCRRAAVPLSNRSGSIEAGQRGWTARGWGPTGCRLPRRTRFIRASLHAEKDDPYPVASAPRTPAALEVQPPDIPAIATSTTSMMTRRLIRSPGPDGSPTKGAQPVGLEHGPSTHLSIRRSRPVS